MILFVEKESLSFFFVCADKADTAQILLMNEIIND